MCENMKEEISLKKMDFNCLFGHGDCVVYMDNSICFWNSMDWSSI